jgi:uncharacterized membrane protein
MTMNTTMPLAARPTGPPRVRERMKVSAWLARVHWQTVVAALILGGVIHITFTLWVATFGRNPTFERLRGELPANRAVVLPPGDARTAAVPYLAPDMQYAMCRYDLSAGPVTLQASLPDPGWSLTVHTPQGDNFYAISAAKDKPTSLTFEIVWTADPPLRGDGIASDVTSTRLNSPTQQGLVIVRAPLRGLAWSGLTQTELAATKCEPAARQPPIR